jgi:hypothetical protein
MKNLLTLSALCLLGFIAKAQTSITTVSGTRYSIGIDAGIPNGNLNQAYTKVLGGSLQADVPLNRQFFVTFNAAYLNMFGHTYSVAQLAGAPSFTSKDVHLLPLKAGIKFFPIAHLYFQGEAGATFLLNKAAYYDDKSVAFVYAPQIGLQVPVGGGDVVDAGIRYEKTSQYSAGPNGSTINFFAMRLAYGF